MPTMIPDSHCDLLTEPVHGVLTTVMPDGQPQSSMVWVDYDGTHVLISTTLERQKGKNMCANPHVSLLIIDPKNTARWIEIRGKVVEYARDETYEEIDRLTRLYTGKHHFYGEIYPVEQKDKETRVTFKIEPVKVSLDAIFK